MLRTVLYTLSALTVYTTSYFGYHTWRQEVRRDWNIEVVNDKSGKPFPCTPRPYDMKDYFYRDAEYDWAQNNGHRERMKEIIAIDAVELESLKEEITAMSARSTWQRVKDVYLK